MSRWKAAGIHLSLSALIGTTVLALLFWIWYPSPYFDASGGKNLTLILLGVDLVLGPLLTLIVFKSGKRSLRFDLAVIAVLQFSALLYGLHVITESRPVFIVAAIDRFVMISASDLDAADLEKGSVPEFRTLSWTGPRTVAAKLPEDAQKRDKVLDSSIAGKDIERLPEYYVEYSTEAPALLGRAKPLSALRAVSATATTVLDRWLEHTGKNPDGVVWLPLVARRASLAMLLDAKSGAVLDALAIDPW